MAAGLPLLISDSQYVYIYGIGPIGMVDGQGNAYYFLRDGLGSVTGVTDVGGNVVATYTYDAYGNLRSTTGTLPNAFRYTGEWYDDETGFYYLRARYYDPSVGMFITRDPWPGTLVRPYSQNPYLWVENNPANETDPSGLKPGDPPVGRIYKDPWGGGSPPPGGGPFGWGFFGRRSSGGSPATVAAVPAVVSLAASLPQAQSALQRFGVSGPIRAFDSFGGLTRSLGPAGPGQVWHHIVEQCRADVFGQIYVQNTANVIRISARLNSDLNAFYSSKRPLLTGSTSQTVREWLKGQTYLQQYEFGLEALDKVSRGIWASSGVSW